MVQGDTLELKCKVSGYPQPKVNWLKDGKALNQTGTRIHLLEYEGSKTGKLQIYDLEYSDEGDYSCVATSEMIFENDTKTMKVRVKGMICLFNPLPQMQILGSSNSAASKDMMSEILTKWGCNFLI